MELIPKIIVVALVVLLVYSLYLMCYLSWGIPVKCEKHKWQTRGVNRYGHTTYRVCLKCGKSEQWQGSINGCFEPCERIRELDDQFDEKGNYIFSE